MRFTLPLLAALLLTLTGCMQSGSLDAMVPKEDVAVAKGYIDDLRQARFTEIEAVADPSIQSSSLSASLAKMAAVFPSGESKSIKIIGVNLGRSPYFTSVNITFEYEFANAWVLTNVAVQKKDGKSTIFGISAYPMADSLEHINHFTLHGKSTRAYVLLGLATLVPLFILATLMVCIRTRGLKRKWLWVIFIVIGFSAFTVNWTTGQISFQVLNFQLLGAGAFAPLYGAWLITVAVPVGAILFLFRRFRSPPESTASVPQVTVQAEEGTPR